MTYSRNEVVLLPIPFADLSSRKVRPAIVLGGNFHGDVFLVPITSEIRNIAIPLQDWRASGLNVPCGVKSQLATVEERLVIKSIGRLTVADQSALDRCLRAWLGL